MKKKQTIIAIASLLALGFIIFNYSNREALAPIHGITVSSPDDIVLGAGQSVDTNDGELSLSFNTLVNDYRCPFGADCIEYGAVTTNITLRTSEKTETLNYASDGVPLEWGRYKISIVDIAPEVMMGKVIDPNDYVVSFHIDKTPLDFVKEPDDTITKNTGTDCLAKGGTWDGEFRECLDINQNACVEISGIWNECASACRNDPKEEMCTMQCVLVCEVK